MGLRNVILAACAAALSAMIPATWADEPPWRFAVISDTQGYTTANNGIGQYANMIAKAIAADNVDFVLISGDLIYGEWPPGSTPSFSAMLQAWFTEMKPLYDANIPVYPVRGNHEAMAIAPENDPTQFLAAFNGFSYIPDNGPAGAERLTYSFKHKNSLVIGIDNYIQNVNQPSVPQDWINQQLSGNTQPHVFTFGHVPIVQIVMTPIIASDTEAGYAFFDSLVDAGAKAYFCGHEHIYNRSVLTRNGKHLFQFVEGTGGGQHLPWTTEGYNSALPQCDITAQLAYYNVYLFGYTLVTVSDDNSFRTEWKVFSDGTASTKCDTLDPFDYSTFKYATYGMETSLAVSAVLESSAVSAVTLTATGNYTDPVRGTTKKTKKETLKTSSPPSSFPYQWLDKIVLFNKKQWNPAMTAEENLAAHPINPVECDMSVTVKNGGSSDESVAYCPPMISSAVDMSGNQILAVSLGEQFKLYGFYFGSKAPKVYLEYTKNGKTAALNLKVDSSSYSFDDLKGKPNASCMDVNLGTSMLILTAPKAWPKDWDTTANHNLVVDNGLGRATIDLANQPPAPPPDPD